jgi:hypothetical protein
MTDCRPGDISDAEWTRRIQTLREYRDGVARELTEAKRKVRMLEAKIAGIDLALKSTTT